jgi:hypothetical protein
VELIELIEGLRAFKGSPLKSELDAYRLVCQQVLDYEARQANSTISDVLKSEGIKGAARCLERDLVDELLREKERELKRLNEERNRV